MNSVVWGVFAVAFGGVVVTDFRGAAQRFHTWSRTVVPFGGPSPQVVGVGFFRLVAGMLAVLGLVELGGGLIDVWRGVAGPAGLPSVPAWFVVMEAVVVGVVLWRTWRRSGLLRRAWEASDGWRRAAAAGMTVSAVAFVVALGYGWGAGAMASWLAGGLSGLALLLSGAPGLESRSSPDRADSSET
ncbi:hypothetical protein [Streptomyces sp. NPDC094049]|uniref:hypothetical protein n=1 Tax=Streptomyces sp. NPDC094049 TaxID=3154987 RepID=UPI00332C12B3